MARSFVVTLWQLQLLLLSMMLVMVQEVCGFSNHRCAADDGKSRPATVRSPWRGSHHGARAQEVLLQEIPV